MHAGPLESVTANAQAEVKLYRERLSACFIHRVFCRSLRRSGDRPHPWLPLCHRVGHPACHLGDNLPDGHGFAPHGPEVSWAGLVANLVPATLGHVVSGLLLMAVAYWYVGRPAPAPRPEPAGEVPAFAREPARSSPLEVS